MSHRRPRFSLFAHRLNCAFWVLGSSTLLFVYGCKLLGVPLSRSAIPGGRVELILPSEMALALVYGLMSWSPATIIGQPAAIRITAFALGFAFLPMLVVFLPRETRLFFWSSPLNELVHVLGGGVGVILFPSLARHLRFRRVDVARDSGT